VIAMLNKFHHSELEIPNAATVAAMQDAREGGLPSFDSVSELLAELDAEN
jgi:hypothetical protein